MRGGTGEVRSWTYEEQVFNEPFESFYEVLTTGAHPKNHPGGLAAALAGAGGKGKGGAKGGKPIPPLPTANPSVRSANSNDVWERTAMIPLSNKPDLDFSRDTEALEIKKLKEAQDRAQALSRGMLEALKKKEAELAALKAENHGAAAAQDEAAIKS